MERMLQKELDGIDAEIIHNKWDTGLKKAKGNFVCLLEKNSAVAPDTIRNNLDTFLSKPAYRKLAMVSSCVDLAEKFDTGKITPIGDGVYVTPSCSEIHAVRYGYAPGAIIRTTSLKKFNHKLSLPPESLSDLLSVFFWENGLRVELNPYSLYYAPECVIYKKAHFKPHPSDKLLQMWDREMIA